MTGKRSASTIQRNSVSTSRMMFLHSVLRRWNLTRFSLNMVQNRVCLHLDKNIQSYKIRKNVKKNCIKKGVKGVKIGAYLGAGASGADVMLIMSGSLMGIMPNVMFLLLVSYVHRTCILKSV